jgi:hypothetical protein
VSVVAKVEGVPVVVERVLAEAVAAELLSSNAAANISADAVTRRSDDVKIYQGCYIRSVCAGSNAYLDVVENILVW